MENSAALSLARRWTVSAAHDEDTSQEQRRASDRAANTTITRASLKC